MIRMIRFNSSFDNLGKFLVEFCRNTSVHGLKYLIERKRHLSERIWWSVAVSVSLLLCIFSIHAVWLEWDENPISLGFIEKQTPVSAIPFPTVTICPQVKATMQAFDVRSAVFYRNTSDPDKQDVYADLCSGMFGYDFLKKRDKFTDESIYDIIKEIAPQLNSTIRWSFWKGRWAGRRMYSPIFTQEGYCFTFNALNAHDMYTDAVAEEIRTVTNNPNMSGWSLSDGYENSGHGNEYPYRVFGTKPRKALACWLRALREDLSMCGKGRGFRILLNVPGDAIRSSNFPMNVPFSQRSTIRIKPRIITTSDELRSYSPAQRQCFFDHERKLKFYKIYTQNNCEMECTANFSKQECGCVKFHMPRDANTKICGPRYIHCRQEAVNKLFGEDIIEGMKDKSAREFRERCNCLPSCTSITYDVDIDKDNSMASYLESRYNRTMEASLVISYREPYVSSLHRYVTYSLADFLAISGGLLQLFVGASLLSIIEFIYYCTLRLYWNIRQSRVENIVPLQTKTIDNNIFVS